MLNSIPRAQTENPERLATSHHVTPPSTPPDQNTALLLGLQTTWPQYRSVIGPRIAIYSSHSFGMM